MKQRMLSRRSTLKIGTGSLIGAAVITGNVGSSLARQATPDATPIASPVAGLLGTPGELVVYSGRNEELIGPVITMAEQAADFAMEVRYGQTAELAIALLEEGTGTPASLFIAQDAGALGQLAAEDRLAPLPQELLDRVDPRFRSADGVWVGVSGRARVLAFNSDAMTEADMPESLLDLADEQWAGQVGWAPENGSFQSQVTAMRQLLGEDETRAWLEAMIANDVVVFEGNGPIVRAVAAGEISVGLVNHYYKWEIQKEEGSELPVENYYFPGGDVGSLVNVAGAAILKDSPNQDAALAMMDFLTQERAQTYFADTTFEYPLIESVEPAAAVVPLEEIESPDIDLSNLADLEGTIALLTEVGAL
ncbi:MAG: Ferric iron ABC transporter, iron-binding protein [uncultured Thermomicrobiales bacterium]|uniref:Ferric iron ABC transporter, iron-binding protein n=1 Tax=uncultured Thermomicrobiales bacterium TaxID=1645740 RepID=A0A6J4UGK5_9BACT|nr:MAG: Ferric iron ABC transporter, iron-binding protein [uncultured Thermomicrobiales bacterium]